MIFGALSKLLFCSFCSKIFTFGSKIRIMDANTGEKIRQLRELKGFSQEYMTSKLAIS